jgi:L-ribulose-5-phosphate 3-epimerase
MLKSISAWAFNNDRPLTEVFKLAKDNGFEGVEVAIAEEGEITPQSTEADLKRIVEQAHEVGIQIPSLASGLGWGYPLTTTDEATRNKGIELVKSSLQAAKWLGVDAILCVPGGVGAEFIEGFKGAPYAVAYDNALDAFQQIKPVAEETGVAVGIENVWNKFLLSPLEMRDFVDKLDSNQIGVYFDAGNVIATGYAEDWVRTLGHRIKRVHFKDFKRDVGNLDGFCDLLAGDVNYPEVMKALREIGYNGPVTSEFFGAEADLAKISAAMDKILAM